METAKIKKNISINNLKLIIFFISFLFFIYIGKAEAATYYVDNTNGNDANNGISINTAWKTASKASGFIFSPGDNILFKRGGTWRDALIPSSSGGEGNYITYGAYGQGEKPKFLGSIPWNNSSQWKNEGNNIWSTLSSGSVGAEKNLNTSFSADANYWDLYANSVSGASTTGARTTTEGEYYSAPGGYKILSSNNGNRGSDIQFYSSPSNLFSLQAGKYYRLEFKARATQPFTTASVMLHMQGSPYTTYSNGKPVDITTSWNMYAMNFKSRYTATDGRITFYLGNVLPDGASFYIDDISFKELLTDYVPYSDVGSIIFDQGASFGFKKFKLADVKLENDFYDDSQNNLIKLYSINNPAIIHSSIEMAVNEPIVDLRNRSYLKFENFSVSQGGQLGFSITASHHIEIINCDISYIGGSIQEGTIRYGNGIQFWDSSNNIKVENNRLWEIYDAALTTQGDGVVQVFNHVYRNNVIWNAEYGFEFWHRPAETTVDNLVFENNTIIDSGKGWSHNQRPDGVNGRAFMFYWCPAAKSNISIKYNNIVNATESIIRAGDEPDLLNLNIDNNYYVNNFGSLAETKVGGVTVKYTMNQLSDWRSQKQKDLNSMVSSQDGLENYNNKDYRLAYTSAAIDNGQTTLRISDFNGNPIYGAPDIGAYEYQPPYQMGINGIDIAAGARIYGDGKFRNKGIAGGVLANLIITPSNGNFSVYKANEVRPQWMDISNITWNATKKEWTENSAIAGLSGVIHTVGDLAPNNSYLIKVDNEAGKNITGTGCVSGVCKSNTQGKITFTFTGSYSEHVFTVTIKDNVASTPPSSTTNSSPSSTTTSTSTSASTSTSSIKILDGSLIRALEGSEIYLISKGQKELVPNWISFVGFGYKLADVKIIKSDELNLFISADLNKIDSDNDMLTNEEEKKYGTNAASIDTDGDGYTDYEEIKNNYSPLIPASKKTFRFFAYGKPRLGSLADEQRLAKELRTKLKLKYVKSQLKGISAKNWSTIVNSYIYGGYTVDAIVKALRYAGKTVHPNIPWALWKNSVDYRMYIEK